MTMRRINFLGYPIDALNMEETVERVDEIIRERIPTQHCVLNANKIFLINADTKISQIVKKCEMVQADGMSIVWAAWLLGLPRLYRITGIDLMERLLIESDRKKYRIYFLGGTQDVLSRLIPVVQKKFPGLVVAGSRNGYFSDEENSRVVANVRASQADILFVAISSPKKETWIADNMGRLDVPLCIGVGGSFDVVVGDVKRAPKWIQNLGCEWIVRLLQEPHRLWKRYLISNCYFAYAVAREFWIKHFRGTSSRSSKQ